MDHNDAQPPGTITVFLADDNLIVREGVRALLDREADLEVVGVAADYDEPVSGAAAANPQVVVSDIRMPPNFQREGIDACKEIRKRHPGTGIVILTQYDDPDYAISLLAEGAAGYAYLLKDRIAEGDQLAERSARWPPAARCSTPRSSRRSSTRCARRGGLTPTRSELLQHGGRGQADQGDRRRARHHARGRRRRRSRASSSSSPRACRAGDGRRARRLRRLHQAIVDREEQGETLSRLLPGGLAEQLRRERPRHRRDRAARSSPC